MKLSLRGFFSIMLLASGLVSLDARADNSGSCNNNGTCEDSSFCPDIQCCDDSCSGDMVFGKTHFSLRPQDSNVARKMVGVEDKIHLFGKEEFYGVLSVGLEYGQTFRRENQLGKFFNFAQGKNCMTYGNKCDGTFDVYGVNFGTTASGTLCFDPIIKNFVADIDFWMGWDEFICGLWTRVQIPVNYTRWDLRLCDTVTGDASATFTPGYVNDDASVSPAVPFSSLKAAFTGSSGFGDAPALKAGKVCGAQKDTQVAGLHFDLGYDFVRRERGHVGASLHFVAPTGTKPNDEFLFNAVSGSQHMWQLGATVNAGYQLWENCDGDQRLGLYFDAVITHLFAAKQNRLFGLLINGASSAGSSYLLLKKFNPNTGDVVGLERAANILNCCSKISADVMADIGVMVQYDCGCFSTGLGWNFWTRSKEKVKEILCTIPANTYGIKGDTDEFDVAGGVATPNNHTQSKSTIGTCAPTDATTVYLTNADIDVCPALSPRAYSNKVFGFFGYNWRDCDWQPYVLVEGDVEFGHDNRAADQWSVMLKGGISF